MDQQVPQEVEDMLAHGRNVAERFKPGQQSVGCPGLVGDGVTWRIPHQVRGIRRAPRRGWLEIED